MNHTSQTVVTIVTWVLVAGIIAVAVRMGRHRHTVLPLAMVLAAALNSFNEPLFDDAYHLFWYTPGQWTLFSTFGYPQPVWVMSAYVIFYCVPGIYIVKRLQDGATRQFLAAAFAVTTLFGAAFETTATSIGTYVYYGPHPFRAITHYPLWLAVMEAAHIMVWSVLIFRIGPWLTGWRSLIAVPLFGISFCSVMYAAGEPGLAVINADGVATWVRYAGASASLGLAAFLVWLVARLLPSSWPKAGSLEAHLSEWLPLEQPVHHAGSPR